MSTVYKVANLMLCGINLGWYPDINPLWIEILGNIRVIWYDVWLRSNIVHFVGWVLRIGLTLWRLTIPVGGRTAPLTSKRCIVFIYSTSMGTEYFKHGIYSPFFRLQNAVCFIILTYLVPVLLTFYIQDVLKFKKK